MRPNPCGSSFDEAQVRGCNNRARAVAHRMMDLLQPFYAGLFFELTAAERRRGRLLSADPAQRSSSVRQRREVSANDLPLGALLHQDESRAAARDRRGSPTFGESRGSVVGVEDRGVLVEHSQRWLVKRESHFLRSASHASQVVEELTLLFESNRYVVEDLEVVVQGGDEGGEIALCGSCGDSFDSLSDIFERRHNSYLPVC